MGGDRGVWKRLLPTAPNGEVWGATARDAAKDLGIALEACTLGQQLSDPEDRFASAYGLAADGAALVRPDGFVA